MSKAMEKASKKYHKIEKDLNELSRQGARRAGRKIVHSDFRIFREKAGVISDNSCWGCISEGYLYTGDSLEDLILVLNTEWKKDKHLVGESIHYLLKDEEIGTKKSK